ncbi:MAG: 50S ribosomal protein L10 [Patescibacteria group bacterium]
MSRLKNIAAVAKLSEKLAKIKGFVLTDYRGLTHKQLEELRAKLRPLSANYTVTKKTLLNRVISSARWADQISNSSGPLATLLIYDEFLPPLKELAKFIKTYNLPQVRLAVIEGREYNSEQVLQIARLPSREILLGQLLYTLNANMQKLVYVLKEVSTHER